MGKYDEERLIELYRNKVSIPEIMVEIGIGNTHLYRILKKNNVKTYPKGSFIKGRIPWNQGLTKEDDRVLKGIEKGVKIRIKNGSYKANSGSFKKGEKIQLGKHWKNPKLSEIRKRLFKEGKIKKLFGSDNSSWKGGIYKLSQHIRLSRPYKSWRKKILKRDKGLCQICFNKGNQVHHIKRFQYLLKKYSIVTYEESLKYPELWDLKLGVVLCEKCHVNIHRNR